MICFYYVCYCHAFIKGNLLTYFVQDQSWKLTGLIIVTALGPQWSNIIPVAITVYIEYKVINGVGLLELTALLGYPSLIQGHCLLHNCH